MNKLVLLALLGCAASAATLKQAVVTPVNGQAVLTSTSAGAVAETTTGSQTISDLSCQNSADVTETSTETGVQAGVGCEASKKLYLFGGAFDYYDTVATTETGAGASYAQSTGVATATARSSLEAGSSGALPTGVCVSTCAGSSYPVPV